MTVKLCKCLDTKSSHKVDRVIHFDRYVLDGGAWTSFSVFQCLECFGYCGFPQNNLELALEDGTSETKIMLGLIPKFRSMM